MLLALQHGLESHFMTVVNKLKIKKQTPDRLISLICLSHHLDFRATKNCTFPQPEHAFVTRTVGRLLMLVH